MKLLFLSILGLSLAESELKQKYYEDSEAAESIELENLKPAASVYASVPYSSGNQPQLVPPQQYYPQYPPQPTWSQSKPPNPPIRPATPPPYVPGFTTGPVQSDYVPPQPPHHHHYTTTSVPVIKNEQYFGDNGSYKYEYLIGDGTWVGKEGWFTSPKKTEESLVKKGWYQYLGGDGKTYTVTYWADHTGYHAYGEHLPTPAPIPPAIQASIDRKAKEEAAKAEAEKNKPGYDATIRPIYQDTPQNLPPYYRPQQPSYPPQQTYYPTQ